MPPVWRNQMTPNYGRAVGAIGSTSLPYAGGSLGVAGPATAAQGMTAGMSMRNPMSRAPMNNNPMGVQAPSQLQGVGNMQQAARNVLMQQPPGANTAMRPLNMPGMQFDAGRNAMTPAPRTPLMRQPMDPYSNEVGRLSGGSLTRSDDQRWSRMARQAGVRPQDMAQWRALKIKEGGALPGIQSTQGSPFVGPIKPPGIPPANQVVNAAPQMAANPAAASPAEQRQAAFAQALQNNKNRDMGYANEAINIANDPSMSAMQHLGRSSMLALNRTGSMIGDAYKRIAYGDPSQAAYGDLEQKTKAERDYANMQTAQRQDQRAKWAREDAVLPVKSWMDTQLARLRGRNQGNADFQNLQRYATTPQPWRNVIYGEERSYPGY